MKKKYISIFIILCLIGVNISIVSADDYEIEKNNKINNILTNNNYNGYEIQWEMNFGKELTYGGRFEGPQPIGDCDNDGKNELLIGGRDGKIRVFEWDENKQTYLEMHTLFCPLYPQQCTDPGGFAIGDLTGDGRNEIGATWGTSVHKWNGKKYRTIGLNSWIFRKGGGSADCYIGDYDNDGKNELIVAGGPFYQGSTVPEIVIYKMTNFGLIREAVWDAPDDDYTYIYMPGMGDIDDDGENEIVCGSGWDVYVLDWNKNTKKFDETIIKKTSGYYYPFACVLKDSDMDGKAEIHIGYMDPLISIMEWNGVDYEVKFEKEWPEEGSIIEGVDVGDVDDDGLAEVCVGTDLVHILQWNGSTYIEEAVLPTFGDLAVVSIGDCDNDGKNEINVGSVFAYPGQSYMSWVFKYGYNPLKKSPTNLATGNLKVYVKKSSNNELIINASVAAWNLETKTWYDIQPKSDSYNTYTRKFLPVGEYLLRVQVEGYEKKETTITINSGEETTHTFTLKYVLPRSYHPYDIPNFIERIIEFFPNIHKILRFLFMF